MIGLLLAAGRGTRMKSELPKVLYSVNDEPLCFSGFRALYEVCETVVVVVGYRGADVKAAILSRAMEVYGEAELQKKVVFSTQETQSGTGDAVRAGLQGLGKQINSHKKVLIVNGDLPLIRPETLKSLVKSQDSMKLGVACLSLKMREPLGLGRILRNEMGNLLGIREDKDASSDEKKIKEVNGGVYSFQTEFLLEGLKKLNSNNKQNEFYLTDLLKSNKAYLAEAIVAKNPWDLFGVNNTYELAIARGVAQTRLQKKLSETLGVDFMNPGNTHISARAIFEGACSVGPGVVVKGVSKFSKNCELDGMNFIDSSTLGEGAHILWGSVLNKAVVEAGASVGPMAHLRPQSRVGLKAKVGNFVELKNTRLGKGAKVSHLSYLGDAEVGDAANVGCGTITCNYDGFQKHTTVIGKGAFIGSDTQLVAPVNIGEEAYIGSGSTITEDIPAGALALSRAELIIKPGYAKKMAQKKEQKNTKKKGNS